MSSRVKDIFLDALDIPAAERTAWLLAHCPDQACREQVLALLAAHEVAPTFDPPKAAASSGGTDGDAARGAIEDVGDVIGDGKYELVRRLGEGGFGVVFLAQQRFPIERPVAIKLLKFASDGSQIAARFEAERQTLARMDHPQIARVYDAGTTDRGRPYFVMEYVDGVPITDFCYGRKALLVERFELFAQVCMAVQHAHGKGVIHRDLKPGNILVNLVDGRPMPKVIDFGIAKAVDPLEDDVLPQMTLEAQIIGTPQYMAPEQATLGKKIVDTRSDIYSLGTVLYELTASTPPFDPGELRRVGLDEVCRIVRERMPTRPSTRIATDDRWTELRRKRLSKLVAGEVDWIVMRAMAKEPERRYQTAAELAEDLRRFIRHEPVHARPPSRAYAARKFVRRNRPEVALATLALAALMGVAVFATLKERASRLARDLAQRNELIAVESAERARAAEARALEQRDLAATQLARANAIATFARQMLAGIGPSVARGRDTALLKDVLDVAVRGVDPTLAQRPTIDLGVRTMIAQAQYDLGDFDRALRTLRPAFDALHDNAGLRDAPERLRAGTLLTTILSESGDGKGASEIAEETVGGYARVGDERSFEALSARVAQASALRRSRRFDEAMRVDTDVLDRLVEAGQGDSDFALLVRNAIASILVDLKRPLDALAQWTSVLSIQQRRHGGTHPGTLTTMSNLAYAYETTGQPEKAELYGRLVLEQERRLYEPGHPNLVKTLNNLGAVLLTLDRVDDAAALLDEANAIAQAKPDSTRRYVRPLLVQTMELRLRQRRYDDAIAVATRLRDGYAEEFGERSVRTLSANTLLIGCLADAGRFAEAWMRVGALGLDTLPAELADDQRSALHAAVAQTLLGLGRVDEARQQAAIARSLAKPVAEGGAFVTRRLIRVERALADLLPATSQPTTQVANPERAPATGEHAGIR